MPSHLFCYGTLCLPEVMRRVIGEVPASATAELADFASYALAGRVYPGIVPQNGARVSGLMYYALGRAQFAKLDAYEGAEYQRVRVWVSAAQERRIQVWTYVLAPRYYHRLTTKGWSLARFEREHLSQYLHRNQNKLDGLHGRDTVQRA
ncbi:MAG: gamma-glutamylcyclotransferase [Gammaproteobacteria bacterium]|nr:gamma-glutamylcyclotransferase [Gammaproteobacteria bacterium]